MEQSKSPMTKRQIKAMKRKVEKEKADIANFIKENKVAISSSSIDGNDSRRKTYAPGKTGPYDILQEQQSYNLCCTS